LRRGYGCEVLPHCGRNQTVEQVEIPGLQEWFEAHVIIHFLFNSRGFLYVDDFLKVEAFSLEHFCI
jgi:hypothetical protein